MQVLKIRAYEYSELNQEGKTAVKHWLDEVPIEVENDAGESEFRYFTDMEDEDLQDHCESNGYLFTTLGRDDNSLHRIRRQSSPLQSPQR